MTSRSDASRVSGRLTNLIMQSLTGVHAFLAEGSRGAWRYEPEVAPFGALEHQTLECITQLADLMRPGEEVCLIDQQADAPRLFDLVTQSDVVQMVYTATPASNDPLPSDARRLSPGDIPQMEELIAAVFPGYFRRRTIEMGRYFGIFVNDQLAAMAGERLVAPGLREISSICTHTAHQGKGLAARLTRFLIADLLIKGQTPFLHVGGQNLTARRLYTKLGFEESKNIAVALYRRKI